MCSASTIIASNTSTLPIGEIASVAKRPQNIVGMHYFSPVPKMPLLEVIPHEGTAQAVTAAAVDVGIRQGKTVIAVKDVPGFYVNRCLGPFLSESLAVVQQGVDPLKLNKGLTDFGYPVGGITLADEVGIDVATHVCHNLVGEQPKFLGVRMEGGDLSMLDDFVSAGLLGKKAGKGFFDHGGKEKKKPIAKEAQELLDKYRHPTKDASKLPIEEASGRRRPRPPRPRPPRPRRARAPLIVHAARTPHPAPLASPHRSSSAACSASSPRRSTASRTASSPRRATATSAPSSASDSRPSSAGRSCGSTPSAPTSSSPR